MTAAALAIGALLACACVLFVALPFLREPDPVEDRLDAPGALEKRALELAEEKDRALGRAQGARVRPSHRQDLG